MIRESGLVLLPCAVCNVCQAEWGNCIKMVHTHKCQDHRGVSLISPLAHLHRNERGNTPHRQVLTSAQCNLHCFLFTKSIFTINFLLLCGFKARNKMAMSWMIVVLCTRGICWWWANAILSISFLISANKRRGLHFTSRDILDAAMRPMIQLYHWSYQFWTFI